MSSDAQPSSFSTDQWLIGASGKDLLLVPDVPPYECTLDCTPYTVTRRGTDGHTIATLPGVTAVHPGGWVSQYRDPKAATSLVHTMHASPDNNDATEEARQKLRKLPKQLVHIDTGQTTDTTGHDRGRTQRAERPRTGRLPGRLHRGVLKRAQARLLAQCRDDGHRHTENLEQFTNN